ncbi:MULTISPECIES: porin [unclassified Aureimonas]|uniref:porin n=1 Tax=Aureimonas sp. Leaf460 TaxID=1736384 RepID=UPI000A993361|nr:MULTISPECIES: porin [unclassified Aureimonas]
MSLRSVILSATALLAVITSARAADTSVVMVEPEPAEYVRVCDVYGKGYFYELQRDWAREATIPGFMDVFKSFDGFNPEKAAASHAA